MSDPILLPEPLLDVGQVSELLGVRERWVYEHASEMPHYYVGRYLRFRASELEAWLQAQREQRTS